MYRPSWLLKQNMIKLNSYGQHLRPTVLWPGDLSVEVQHSHRRHGNRARGSATCFTAPGDISIFWTKKNLLGTWNSGEMVVVCSGFIRQWRNAFVWPKDIESTMKASTIILMMIVLLVLFIKNNIYIWKIMSKYMQIPESTVSSLKQIQRFYEIITFTTWDNDTHLAPSSNSWTETAKIPSSPTCPTMGWRSPGNQSSFVSHQLV